MGVRLVVKNTSDKTHFYLTFGITAKLNDFSFERQFIAHVYRTFSCPQRRHERLDGNPSVLQASLSFKPAFL